MISAVGASQTVIILAIWIIQPLMHYVMYLSYKHTLRLTIHFMLELFIETKFINITQLVISSNQMKIHLVFLKLFIKSCVLISKCKI